MESTVFIMLLGRRAMCPECAGMLHMVGEDRLRCVDCNTWYEILEPGRVEGELLVRKMDGSHRVAIEPQ